ncbi:MAG: branched-chain amino acid ABC transporter permease [Candidatus Tectomicrobia bacterium]|uniref:Branched-chain amino acid ABC transporter permease n=1 Tax=Tectimicrobiota bacterium TaxID=2528274 RepID=A0A933LRP9_UNCTE|nr:branched-chain amino acid ABC transporter permease [Candidatus Tectomicrobia bacterium]
MFPWVITNTYYISVTIFIAIHGLIAIGLSLVIGYAGQISLGHAAFFGLGAYTSGILATKYGFPIFLSLFLAILFTAGVSYLIAVPSLKLKGHYLAMATLGFSEIIFILFNELIDLTGGPSGFGNIPKLNIFKYQFQGDWQYFYVSWSIVIVALLLSLNIIHSRVGRALRALHGSEIAANAMGVDVARYKVLVFILSAIYASLAGGLYAHYMTFLSPSSFSLMFSILLVIMVVVGGMSNIWGGLMGAGLFTFLPEFLRIFKDYDILIYGGILVFIMIFMPKGIVVELPLLFRRFVLSHKDPST